MRQIRFASLVLVFILAACAVPASPAVPTSPPSRGEIRIGYISAHNVSDLPYLMISDALEKQGYTFTESVFESQDVTADALSRGQLDIAYGGASALWPAIQKGANFVAVAPSYANPYSIVATQAIKTCADLNGKRYGIGSSSGTNTFLSKEYIRENCPDAAPQYLTIANSQARTAALLADGLDATTVEIADMQELERQMPGKFHVLAEFAQVFPKFKFGLVYVNRDFAAKHPEMVKDFVSATVATFRNVHTNPQSVCDAAVRHLELSPEQAKAAVDPYLASQIWKFDEQNISESFQFTLDTMVELGTMSAGAKLEDLADLSYLNEVLIESQ